LNIRAINTLPQEPIDGVYRVEATGKVALGPSYGRVDLKDLTLEEAEAAIRKHMDRQLKNFAVLVTRAFPEAGGEGTSRDLEGRVRQLEKEVRALRATVEELQKKPRD
jgi:hypothetical protein